MNDESHPRRTTCEDWFESGLESLRDEGEHALSVDALCHRMGRTKGSFYHHFGHRDDFVRRLLKHWEETFTHRVIGDLDEIPDPRKRLQSLGRRVVTDLDGRLERAIRFWSQREPEARHAIARVDRAREAYVREQLESTIGDPGRARLAARIYLTLMVGAQMVARQLTPGELGELMEYLDSLRPTVEQ